jgi:O-antigen ligase/tetratricopeptide (TPR) repeat protein
MSFRAQTLSPVSFGLPAAQRTDWRRATRLLEGTVFYALLALIPLAAVPYGTVEEWWESSFQCVVFALAALWSVEGLLSGRWFVREHRLLLPLVPLLGFVFWQALPAGRATVGGVGVWLSSSADAYETRLVAFRFLALLLFAAMLLRYTSSSRRMAALVYAVIGVGVLSGVFGLVRQAAHQDGDGFLLARLQPQLGYGQFINNNHFALLMEMGLGLLLGLMTGGAARRRGGLLFLYCASCAVLWPALVLSNSRGGVFSMFGQIAFLTLLHRRVQSSRWARPLEPARGRARVIPAAVARAALAACLLLVVCAGVIWIGGDSLLGRMEHLRGEVSAEGDQNRVTPRRLEMWRAAWLMFKDHPVAGIGFGGYSVALPQYYDATGAYVPQQAHNDYLEILASGGLIAAALVAWFVGGVVARARKCLRSREPFRRAACFGGLAGLCAVALHGLVDFGLHITANALICIALVAMATVHVKTRERGSVAGRGRKDRLPADAPAAPGATQPARLGRVLASGVCLLVCLGAMRATARAGLSRWYSTSPERECLLSLAGESVRLSPADPAAHLFRAGLLSAAGEDGGALAELERAVSLRPQDYDLWTYVGFAREQVGDLPGALAAFQEAARLAPYYSPPRWQLASTLLRVGRREQAVAEFARAAASDPELLPPAIEQLWEVLGGDGEAVARALGTQSQASQLAFLRFYMKQGKFAEAIALLRQAGSAADAERRVLTAELIAAKRFTEAYDAWSSAGRHGDVGRGGLAAVNDGSFEGDVSLAETGFGWQVIGDGNSLVVSLDTKEPRDGARSLLLDFRGEPAHTPLVSQLILVESNTRYRLSFAARTQELVTTGVPGVELLDAGGDQQLMTPTLLPRGSSSWQDYTAEFVTGHSTSAVLLTVRRQECPLQPCFIVGRVWLDGFSLRKL